MGLNKRIAIYAGTFDPLTRGHEDLLRRAVNLFDHVIVAIAASRAKRPFFTLEERFEMAQEILCPYPNVEVCSFDGLLMDFLHAKGAKVILRGLRAASGTGGSSSAAKSGPASSSSSSAACAG